MTLHPRPGAAPPPGPAPEGEGARESVFLHAGTIHVARRPCAIATVLGSCVSVCLYDRAAGVGGMNHFLLPLAARREASPRFGPPAMEALLRGVVAAGARRERVEAKVFGGASMLEAFAGRNLGGENVELALDFLGAERIPVRESDYGGNRGRKVVFHADEGVAWVRVL